MFQRAISGQFQRKLSKICAIFQIHTKRSTWFKTNAFAKSLGEKGQNADPIYYLIVAQFLFI